MSYNYWNQFINDWFKGCTNFPGWKAPNGTLSADYIPEPWWGNDGTKPLHSVVINFNPGQGGCCQLRSNLINYYKGSYANDFVNNTKMQPNPKCWPNNTREWHCKKRAIPVLQHLGLNNSLINIESHLSIELIPWHSNNIAGNDYRNYLKQNIKAIYKNSICFAAHEAARIQNPKLNNVVLLKMSGGFTQSLLDLLKKANCCNYNILKAVSLGNAAFMEFTLSTLPDTTFVSIWGRYSRNNFPEQMKTIISQIP